MISNAICSVVGHKVDRHKVRFNGLTFTGRCQRCSSQMEREHSGWAPVSRTA